MFNKECRICGTFFDAITERRQLCDQCQKNSGKAKADIDKAILDSKRRLGEMPDQQYYTGLCKYCGKEFHSYGRKLEYCSDECLKQHRIHTAVCPICKKELYPLGIIVTRGEKPCSEECKMELKLRKARFHGKAANCKVCGKEFIQKNDWDEFCGTACNTKYTWDVAREQGNIGKCVSCGKDFIKKYDSQDTCTNACYEKQHATQYEERHCVVCGKSFMIHPNASNKTCSTECSKARKSGAARKAE